MHEIKIEDVYKDFSNAKEINEWMNEWMMANLSIIKEMFDFSNYSNKSKYYDHSNKLVVGKMKNKIAGLQLKNLLV